MPRRLRLNLRRFVSGLTGGTFRSAQRGGGGYELREIKEFQPEEDFSAIHLLTSAKREKLFMVLREPERAARIIFLMDLSHSGKFGSGLQTRAGLQTSLLSILGEAACEGTNQIGIIPFTDRIEKFWKPYIGFGKFFGRLGRASKFTDLGRSTNLKTAVDFVCRLKSRPDLVILSSDFIAEENYQLELQRLKSRGDVIALVLFDPKEKELRAPLGGYVEMRDLESRRLLRASGLAGSWPGKSLLEKAGVDHETFSTFDTKSDQIAKLSRLFEGRRASGVRLR